MSDMLFPFAALLCGVLTHTTYEVRVKNSFKKGSTVEVMYALKVDGMCVLHDALGLNLLFGISCMFKNLLMHLFVNRIY
jgi:hypothetical protein